MKPLTYYFTIGTLALPIAFIAFTITPSFQSPFSPATVLADHDENKDDEYSDDNKDQGDDKNNEDPSTPDEKKSSKPKTIRVMKEVIEYRPVTTQVIVTEEAYAKDSDGDGLVDAIDPDPLVPQKEYFTDDDNDGVPNALDEHRGDDDFAYYQFETDDNNNGILDSYENI